MFLVEPENLGYYTSQISKNHFPRATAAARHRITRAKL
jgi:hypothetical protein